MKYTHALFTLLAGFLPLTGNADVELPNIFGNHMVLQRELPVPIWGTTDAHKVVTIQFAGQTAKSKADREGRWKVWLRPLKANSTGRELKVISGVDSTLIRDVLVGEVWVSGGQSNMDYTVGGMARRLPEGKALADAADFNGIRYRKVNEKNSPTPQTDLTGGDWVVWDQHRESVAFLKSNDFHTNPSHPHNRVYMAGCAAGRVQCGCG